MMSSKPAPGGRTPPSTRRNIVMWGWRAPRSSSPPTSPPPRRLGRTSTPSSTPPPDTLRYVVDSKPVMSVPNYSLTSRSPYRWKPGLVGLTTPVLMESKDVVLPLWMCHTVLLIGKSEPVKQVDIFPELNEEISELGQTGHVFKEEFLTKDGDMLVNMKIEADNVGQRWGGIFNAAWPSPHRPHDQGTMAAVYAMIPTGNGGQEGLQLHRVVLWAQRVLQGLSTKDSGLFLVKVGYVRATSDHP